MVRINHTYAIHLSLMLFVVMQCNGVIMVIFHLPLPLKHRTLLQELGLKQVLLGELSHSYELKR